MADTAQLVRHEPFGLLVVEDARLLRADTDLVIQVLFLQFHVGEANLFGCLQPLAVLLVILVNLFLGNGYPIGRNADQRITEIPGLLE